MRFLLPSLVFASLSRVGLVEGSTNRRQLLIVNESSEKVSVEWVHPRSGQNVPLGAPSPGEQISFDSFVNHTFVIRTDDGSANSRASNSTVTFQVSDEPLQTVLVRHGLTLESPSQQPSEEPALSIENKKQDITKHCHDQALINKDRLPGETVMKQLTECLVSSAATLLESLNEKLADENLMRLEVSAAIENKTCADPKKETSDPIEIRTWKYNDEEERIVHVLHNRPSSQIHMIEDFISPEECAAVEASAKKTLHRGTVADGKGGSRLSENRKAWQAGVPHNWGAEGDPIAAVSWRLLAYANEAGGYSMGPDGQEDLMSIQYFGNGTDDPTPDRYTPHCDGDCSGLPHKTGGRVATMVMYCDVPELGGGTNFQNANVFVRPAKGAAAFFSYLDAKTGKMETGFTTHSGCPVYLGTKRIAVQWLRVGVDEENPWDSFDTNTISRKVSEEDDDDN